MILGHELNCFVEVAPQITWASSSKAAARSVRNVHRLQVSEWPRRRFWMKACPRITTLAVRSCFRPALLHYGRTTPIPHPAAPWLNLNSAAPMSSQCISKRAFRPHLILRVGWRGLMQQCLRSYHQGLIDIVAPTTMSYIESNSVGNGSDQVAVSPGQRSHVGSPPDQPTDQHPPLPLTYLL